mmetsp:Transcript_30201/g.44628  ORF Transcript_30201/g.44628 Transcript_30201/m.44628 type:complete len:222 (-) Transcript_30201:1419-2084(-)
MRNDGRDAFVTTRRRVVQTQIHVERLVRLIDVSAIATTHFFFRLSFVVSFGRITGSHLAVKVPRVKMCCWCIIVRRHQSESGVLQEMRPEMKPGEHGSFVPRTDERPTNNHGMLAVEARGREIIVDVMHLKALQWVEVVFGPFPCVSGCVSVPRLGRSESVNRILRAVCHIHVGPGSTFCELVSSSRHHSISLDNFPGSFQVVLLVANHMVLCFCQDTKWL